MIHTWEKDDIWPGRLVYGDDGNGHMIVRFRDTIPHSFYLLDSSDGDLFMPGEGEKDFASALNAHRLLPVPPTIKP